MIGYYKMSMLPISTNALFSVVLFGQTTRGNKYLFTIHPFVMISAELTDVLVVALTTICNATDKQHIVVLNTLGACSTQMMKQFFGVNFDLFRCIGNTGIHRFIIITTCKVVAFTATVFKTICGSPELVHTCTTVADAMCLTHNI
jgi:hypothetical protein